MNEESPWNLDAIVAELLKFRQERNWEQYHRPKELAAAVAIEAAELQELFLWKDGEISKEIIEDKERLSEISDEIADIFIYLLYLTNDLNINLKEAINRKILRNKEKYQT